jgi:putative addiction module component (TIGR02574 family)
MGRALHEIERDAMELSLQDRALLAEHLLATLDTGAEQEDVEESWLLEAERRYQAYREGHLASKPAEQVFADAKKRLP